MPTTWMAFYNLITHHATVLSPVFSIPTNADDALEARESAKETAQFWHIIGTQNALGEVAFATGCSSTGAGSNARLISLIPPNQRNANFEDDGGSQPVRGPAFSDLFGS
jgi:hypothetical protein